MKKSFKFLGVFLLLTLLVGGCGQLIGQTAVVDVENVRNPKAGKMYYQKKDAGLYYYDAQKWNKVTATPKTGEPEIPPVPLPPPSADHKPLLLHVWGNGGQGFESEQGTHRAERWMLSQPQFRDQLPFYGYDHAPEAVVVDRLANGQIVGKQTVSVSVNYFMDAAAMAKTIDYVKRARLDGFSFLWYADDALLREWRRAFVATADKKGLKMAYNLGSFGGGENEYPGNNEYTRSINTIVSHLKADFYQRVDGLPVLSFMLQNYDIEQNGEALSNTRRTMARINAAYGGEIYWILNCDFYEKGDWYKNNGFNAISGYYLYGGYVNGDFKEVIDISGRYNTSHTAAGRAVAPIITCGLDSRARKWYEYGDGGGNYYRWETVMTGLPTLISNTINFMNSTASTKIGFVNHADEHTEQGLGFLPRKLKEGSIDDKVVSIFESVIR